MSLGELGFTDIQLPFKHLVMTSAELKRVDIRTDYDFVLPLNRGQCIVTFKWFYHKDDFERCFTQISSFDWAGRLIGSSSDLELHVEQQNVAQCGPHTFVLCDGPNYPQLSVYNSRLSCLRKVECRNSSTICCNSKFVFGLWAKQNYDYEYDFGD